MGTSSSVVERGEIPSIGGEEAPSVYPAATKRFAAPSAPFIHEENGASLARTVLAIGAEAITNLGMRKGAPNSLSHAGRVETLAFRRRL
jgi:hypothetical protein